MLFWIFSVAGVGAILRKPALTAYGGYTPRPLDSTLVHHISVGCPHVSG